ncbi:MAG: hypothetical protein KDA22_05560, partial [Phycisphaerales bacterium]|nr:hypothetical protein [Phycisphaerales bacterium]
MAVPLVAAAASLAVAMLVPTESWTGWFVHPVRAERGGGVPATTIEGAVFLRGMLVVFALALLGAIPGLRAAQPVEPVPSEPAPTGRERLAMVLLTLLALTVRLPRIGESLWYDEISALLDFAVHGPGPIVANYFVQSNHVLHTLASWLSIEVFGVNEATLRLPALLASVAAVPATWRLVRTVDPTRPSSALALTAAGAMAL